LGQKLDVLSARTDTSQNLRSSSIESPHHLNLHSLLLLVLLVNAKSIHPYIEAVAVQPNLPQGVVAVETDLTRLSTNKNLSVTFRVAPGIGYCLESWCILEFPYSEFH
jgi:hypothetical protein